MGDIAKKYSLKSPAVKRLMREAAELSEPTDQYFAQPLEDNLFEWHFTVRGPSDTEFDDGRYHGRITLPPEYPMKPPSIILLTPNGRFEVGKKICLSMSAHHPETWQPSWSIRTVMLALIGFMPTAGGGAIGALDYTPEERKILAKKSRDWKCETCNNNNISSLLERDPAKEQQEAEEAKELAAQINFKGEDKNKGTPSPTPASEQQQQPNTLPQMQFPQQQAYNNYLSQLYGMHNNPMQNMQLPMQPPPQQQQPPPQQQQPPQLQQQPPQQQSTENNSQEPPETVPSNEATTTATSDTNTTDNNTVLRQRTTAASRIGDDNVSDSLEFTTSSEQTVDRHSRMEKIVLLLTWIVTVCLVILILRRLAMERTSMTK